MSSSVGGRSIDCTRAWVSFVVVIAVTCCCGSHPSDAGVLVCNPVNRHAYELVTDLIGSSFQTSLIDASTRSYNGCDGYLVTLSSYDEFYFVVHSFNNSGIQNNGFWLGANETSTDVFSWISGPEGANGTQISSGRFPSTVTCPGFCSWCQGEPNNWNGTSETKAIVWYYAYSVGDPYDYCWSDTVPTYPFAYPMVEYGNATCLPCPPSPSASPSTSPSTTQQSSPALSLTGTLSSSATVSTTVRSNEASPVITNTPKPVASTPRPPMLNPTQEPCVGCEVETTTFTFTEKSSERTVTIPFRKGNSIGGRVTIRPGTFPPGCVLTVKQSRVDEETKKETECGDTEETVVSVAIDLKIDGGRKCRSSNFDRPVLLEFYSKIDDPKDACVAFSDDPRSHHWKCLRDLSTEKEQFYTRVRSKTDHFTTFAVLLTSSDDCSDWIWITSLVIVASCLVFSIGTVLTYYGSSKFRAFVGGFKASSISTIVKKADENKEEQVSEIVKQQ